jgi:hypothetical protein
MLHLRIPHNSQLRIPHNSLSLNSVKENANGGGKCD